MPVISAKDLNLWYGDFKALKNISLDVGEREITALIGPSGCGKSTFLKTLNRMNDLVPGVRIEGDVRLKGQDIFARDMELTDLRRRVGMVFQKANPFPMSIYDNITYGPKLHGVRNKAELDELVESSLRGAALWDEVKDRLKKSALGLSGGQQQRLCIARALAVNPKLIFCDESVSALDVSVQAQILNLFQSLKEQFHLTYVFIGHDLAVVRYISDRVMVMYLGKVMEIAPYSELTGDNIHPYTRALLSAVPEPSITLHKERILLEGDIPSAVDPPAGCRFCQRCFMAKPICFEQEPDMKTVGPDHCVRCHFAKEG